MVNIMTNNLASQKKQLKKSLRIIVKGIQFLNLSNEMLNACYIS
jgi:hypothetical protein